MTLNQVKYAITIAKHQSFSKAANELFITQPALSHQISALERELGVALFTRSSQGVHLTNEGIAFYEEMEDALLVWEKCQMQLQKRIQKSKEFLTIGIGCRTFSTGIFQEIISFFDQIPNLEVTFITNINENILSSLTQNHMVFAIDRLPPKELLSSRFEQEYVTQELYSERQCVLMSKKDERSKLPEIAFTALNGDTFISGGGDSLDNQILTHSCKKYQIEKVNTYRCDNIETIMHLIEQGKGVALGPKSFGEYYHIAAIPMIPQTHVPLYAITTKQNQNHPYYKALTTHLKNSL